jgi:hypothetical protein
MHVIISKWRIKMKYGSVLGSLESGSKCARKGWNGKGMFIYLTKGSTIAIDKLKQETKQHLFGNKIHIEGETIKINDHIDMRTADGSITVGWLPSQVDQLAHDWEVI